MVALKNPLADMSDMPEDVALYIGVLERTILGFTIQEAKFRALLEMLTGEAWDDTKTDLEVSQLQELAISSMERKLGISRFEAQQIIRRNKLAANGEQVE